MGPNPQGLVIFLPDGRYSLQLSRADRPTLHRTIVTAQVSGSASPVIVAATN
jgi:hypothetical protein